jgi:hypothetical protein
VGRLAAASRRAAFQTSPQRLQRQYALSSGVRAVVEINDDRQAGQAMGTVTGAVTDVRSALPLPDS